MPDIYKQNSTPFLDFLAVKSADGMPDKTLNASTAGLTVNIVRDNLALSPIASFQTGTGPDDYAAGNLFHLGGGVYRLAISTSLISSYAGRIRITGSYGAGDLFGTEYTVVNHDPDSQIAAPGDDMNAAEIGGATASLALIAAQIFADSEWTDLRSDVTGIATVQGTHTTTLSTITTNQGTMSATLSSIETDTNTDIPALINGLNQSASRRTTLNTSTAVEIPDSGTATLLIELRTFDPDGALVAAQSTPSLTATGGVSGDLSGDLSSVSNPSTGVYRWTYTANAGDTVEQLIFDSSAQLSDGTFTSRVFSAATDAVAIDFTAADRATLASILLASQSADTEVKKVPRAATAVTAGGSVQRTNNSSAQTLNETINGNAA